MSIAPTHTWIPSHPALRESPPGTMRIGQSRVTLDVMLEGHHEGITAEEIVEQFDTLKIEDVRAVLVYYRENREKVDAYIAQRRREGEELRAIIESEPKFAQFRDKMRERMKRHKLEET